MANKRLIAHGTPASSGTYSGVTRVVRELRELDEVEEGDVLVVRSSSPAWTVGMLKSGAIVAELGGPICHAAIVARELGIPAVVAVDDAPEVLATGTRVTIDGTRGEIFAAPEQV